MQLDHENPWPGLDSFEENAHEFFFGRDVEARSLLDHVRDAPVTVLFGRSGLGKTSLLRAGLFPLLRDNNYVPVYVRFELTPGSEPPARQLLQSVRNSIRADVPDAILPSDDETLWEYLHHNDFELWSAQNYPLTPVIVMDQFEELFTLGERVPDLVRAFRNDFGDLAENRIPADLAARIEADESVAVRFDLRSRGYKLLVSLREDFLPELEGWRQLIPSLGRSRVRLCGLQQDEAIDAVRKPATDLMSDELARRVVSIVAGENLRSGHSAEPPSADDSDEDFEAREVEPALLSLFCRELNEERKRLGRTQFDKQLVEEGTRDILSNYYMSCVRDLPPRVPRFIESELITEKGFRDSYVRDDAVPAFLTEDELDRLIGSRLLRLEDRYGAQRIELTHDVLTPVVREHRDRRRAEEEKAELATRAEEAHEREKAAQAHAAAEQHAKEEALENARTLLRQTRILYVALGVMLLLAVVTGSFFYWGYTKQQEARDQLFNRTASSLLGDSQLMLAGLSPSRSRDQVIIQRLLAGNAIPSSDSSRSISSKYALLTALNQERDLLKIIDIEPAVTSVAFTPDGNEVVSGDIANTVRLWDVGGVGTPTAEPARSIHGPSEHVHRSMGGEEGSWVNSVAVSRDGARIVSGSGGDENTVRIWDAASRQPIGAPLKGNEEEVLSVTFNPDGTRVVSGGADATVRVWDVASGQPVGQPLRGHTDWVKSVAFSPDGTRIVSSGDDNTVRLWDVATGGPIGQPMRHGDFVNAVAFSPDGARIVSVSDDKTVRLWDAASGQEIKRQTTADRVTSVAFSPDGARIASGGTDKMIRLWDANNLEEAGLLSGHEAPVLAVAFSADSRRLVSAGGDDGTVRIWDVSNWQPMRGHSEMAWAAFDDDGSRVLSASEDKTARWWDAKTSRPIGEPISVPDDDVRALFPISDDRLLSLGTVNTIGLWDAHSRTPIGEPLRLPSNPFRLITTDDAVNRIAVQLEPRTLQVFDAELRPVTRIELDDTEGDASTMAFSRDGHIFATGTEKGIVRLWDSDTGAAIGQPMKGPESYVTSIAFSDDGHRMAAMCSCYLLRLWDTGSFQPVRDDIQLNTVPTAVALNLDGRTFAAGGDDGTVQLWDVDDGSPMGTPFAGHSGLVTSLDFSPDGKKLVSASDDGSVRMWPVLSRSPEEAREALCSKITHDMSPDQWRMWVSPEIDYIDACGDALPNTDWSE